MPYPMNQSNDYLRRAKGLIPGQTQTFSKRASWFVEGVYPTYLKRGNGCLVWDADGNKYTDLIMGLGAVTLGYCYTKVDWAIMRQLRDGIIFSLPHPLEVELSELLNSIIPCAEMVRFTKTGSLATQAAVRAARAFTGRSKIAYRGYHGELEWYAITTERPKGIPEVYGDYMLQFDYNDIGSLERVFTKNPNQIAAVIMEPVIFDNPKSDFLHQVKWLAQNHGALLIFDEIVTGFRMVLGGAQAFFDVVPDIATFGKGMANGMPLAAVVGRADVMRECEEIFFSSTFGGECLSLAAAVATIKEMRSKNTIRHVWEMGSRLTGSLLDAGIATTGYSCRPAIIIPNETVETRSLFMQECLKRGILMHSFAINLCYEHKEEDIDCVARACIEAYEVVQKAVNEGNVSEKLEGKIIQPAFRRL